MAHEMKRMKMTFCGQYSSLCRGAHKILPTSTCVLRANECINLSVVPDPATPWTVAHQGPLSMGFSRQEYWSRLPLPSLRDLADPGIEPGSPALQADSLPFDLQGSP